MINKEINTRTTITISKDLKSKIETLAKNDNRSMNNMIITILDSYIKENFDFRYEEKISKGTSGKDSKNLPGATEQGSSRGAGNSWKENEQER